MFLIVHGWQMSPGDYPSWSLTGGLVFVDIYAAALIVSALQPGTWTYNILGVYPLRWLGRLSYGAYVFHDLLYGFFVHLVVHHPPEQLRMGQRLPFSVAILAFFVTLVLAWLSFRFFESPFLDVKDRWTRKPKALDGEALPFAGERGKEHAVV